MYSMTGYGRGTASLEGRELTIELKSVNNRFLDIGMKLPRQLSFLEDGLRKLLPPPGRAPRLWTWLTISPFQRP